MVSVLLDAGAGDHWKFTENGIAVGRSEGLAIASLSAFRAGTFGESCVNGESQYDLSELAYVLTSDLQLGH